MIFQLLAAAMLLHPVHATLSEVQWNPKSQRLELALRLDALDEQWLRRRYAETTLAGDRVTTTRQWAIPYLRQHVRVIPHPKPKQPDPTTYHWVGRDRDGAHVWWYFEIEPADGKQPQWIEQRMLFDREPDYAHHIVILNSKPKRSLTLKQNQMRGRLIDSSSNSER